MTDRGYKELVEQVHRPPYAAVTQFVCSDCGSCVVDLVAHDRFHDLHDDIAAVLVWGTGRD